MQRSTRIQKVNSDCAPHVVVKSSLSALWIMASVFQPMRSQAYSKCFRKWHRAEISLKEDLELGSLCAKDSLASMGARSRRGVGALGTGVNSSSACRCESPKFP